MQGHTEELKSQKKKQKNSATILQIQLRSTNLSSLVVHYDDVVRIDFKYNFRVYLQKTSQIQKYIGSRWAVNESARLWVSVTEKRRIYKTYSLSKLEQPNKIL